MVSIATGILYLLFGAIGFILAFLVAKTIIKTIARFLFFLPEYLWHNLTVLVIVGFFVALLWLMASVA